VGRMKREQGKWATDWCKRDGGGASAVQPHVSVCLSIRATLLLCTVVSGVPRARRSFAETAAATVSYLMWALCRNKTRGTVGDIGCPLAVSCD
jgi:hypothetical protein